MKNRIVCKVFSLALSHVTTKTYFVIFHLFILAVEDNHFSIFAHLLTNQFQHTRGAKLALAQSGVRDLNYFSALGLLIVMASIYFPSNLSVSFLIYVCVWM